MPRAVPKKRKSDDDTSPQPPQRDKPIIDLCEDEATDDDDDEAVPSDSSPPDAPMEGPRKNVSSSDWRKIITKRSDRKKDPSLPAIYYANMRTGETSWFPPRPLLPGEEQNNETASAGEKVNNPSKSGMKKYFPRIRQPKVTPEEELVLSEPEDVESDTEEDVDMINAEDAVEELSEVEKIQREVFTGHKPEFLRMHGEGGLIEKTKELGIYEDKILRVQLEEKLMQHFITKFGSVGCTDPVDAYFLSPIFKQEEQDIMAERKEDYNDKRKRKFAKAAVKKRGRKNKTTKKAPLSLQVSFALIICCPII